MKKRLRVLALTHPGQVPPRITKGLTVKEHPWKLEHHVRGALKELGHELQFLGVESELKPIREAIETWKPDIAFNLLESFDGNVLLDHSVVSYLEMLRVPYTGCNPRGLVLARGKALSKKIASYHRIKVPAFAVFRMGRKIRRPARLRFPLFVKSAFDDASLGIAKASLVETDEKLEERVRMFHERYETDAIAEQFIPGREIYVGVLGNDRITVLPPGELWLKKKTDEPFIATEKLKFDLPYQKKVGLRMTRARPLPDGVDAKLRRHTRRLYRALGLSGYARLDYRITEDGQVFFLEANPNPDISKDEELAHAAKAASIPYEKLIQRLLSLGLQRANRSQ